MSISPAQVLYREVGDAQTLSETEAARLTDQARIMIENHAGRSIDNVPGAILNLAIVAVARDLHTMAKAPGGVFSPFADAPAVRLARDPMKAAYPLISPYIKGGFS